MWTGEGCLHSIDSYYARLLKSLKTQWYRIKFNLISGHNHWMVKVRCSGDDKGVIRGESTVENEAASEGVHGTDCCGQSKNFA